MARFTTSSAMVVGLVCCALFAPLATATPRRGHFSRGSYHAAYFAVYRPRPFRMKRSLRFSSVRLTKV